MAEQPKACQIVTDIAQKILDGINKIDGGLGKLQSLADRTAGFLDGLPPDIPSVPKPDLDVLKDVKAACPFITKYIPDWYNNALDDLAKAGAMADSFLGQMQGRIDDAFDSFLGPVSSKLNEISNFIGSARAQLSVLERALEAIVRCIEKLCDLATKEYWQGELDRIKGEVKPAVEEWVGDEDESIWKGNFVTKQTSKKVSAYKSFVKDIDRGFGTSSSIDADPLAAN